MSLIQRLKNPAPGFHGRVRRDLNRLRWTVFCAVLLLFFPAGAAQGGDSRDDWNRISGPAAIINQAPIQLLFLQPPPDRAETYPERRFSVSLVTSIANTLLWDQSDRYLGFIDTEIIRTSIELKYGLFSRFEVGMSIPFLYGSGGFMDHGILEFEKLLGAARNLREKEDQNKRANTYAYSVAKNGRVFIEGKDGASGLGDLALRVKARLLNEGDRVPCTSVRFAVKIPTGDDDRAFGSGAADYGAGLLVQKTVKRFTVYWNADIIFPGQAYKQVDVSLRPYYSLMLGGEYKLSERLSGLMQLSYITRPFQDTGLDLLDGRIWDILLGLSYVTKAGFFVQGGLVEDIIGSSDTGADVTFFLNVGKNF